MIGNTRICKYWHQYTIQALSHIRVKLIGKNDRVMSVHLWFSTILHLDYKNKNTPIIFGLCEKINITLKNLNLNIEIPLPLTFEVVDSRMQKF